MLEFFRQYQRAFFVAITVVIVISFSFFGTFEAFFAKGQEDPVAFCAIDGTKISRSELNDMIAFLTSDAHDHLFWNVWAGNALNDGVIAQDIIKTGIAPLLIQPYAKEIQEELQPRLEKERRYTPYVNPKASFISAEQAWAYFAPDMKHQFDALRACSNALDPDAIQLRIQLFDAERKFPGLYLKQFLRYQESQHSWLPPDEQLQRQDLSLFGYHTVQDWFGRRFVELAAKFIINTSRVAQAQGFVVTKDEALQSLYANGERSYQKSRSNPYLGVENANDFVREQLRRLGFDQSRAAKVWRQVLLSRKLASAVSDSVLVSRLPYEEFYNDLHHYGDTDLYRLPDELQVTTLADVEKLEVYLTAIRATPPSAEKGVKYLELPCQFLDASVVKKNFPELVQKTFVLKYATLDKDMLQAKVGLKNTWQWQVQDENWEKLQKQFPEIAQHAADTQQRRLAILNALDYQRRLFIDSFSRQAIVDENPEWITKSLEGLQLKEETVEIRYEGGHCPLLGISNRGELIALLSSSELNGWDNRLLSYSQDGQHYHRIQVITRDDKESVLPYEKVVRDGTMQVLLDRVLDSAYVRIRQQKPVRFLKENGEWKPLSEVRDEIANSHFNALIESLDSVRKIEEKKLPHFCDWKNEEQSRVACRFLPHAKRAYESLNNKEVRSQWIRDAASENSAVFDPRLIQTRERIVKKEPTFSFHEEVFTVQENGWAPLRYSEKEGVSFFMVEKFGTLGYENEIRDKMMEAKKILGNEAVCVAAQKLLQDMQEAGALTLTP